MNNKKKQWHSLGDFLQAKEERERAQNEKSEGKTVESTKLKKSTGVRTPVDTPVSTPVATGVVGTVLDQDSSNASVTPLPDAKSADAEAKSKQHYLDATHTASEQRIYSVMYRETLSKGQTERHFGFKELCNKTGIRSDRTIRLALDGLQEKLSIEIVSYSHGNPLGPRYRVYDPKEIIKRRKAAGMEIDTQSKKITAPPVPTGVPTGVGTGVPTGVPTGGKNYGSI